MENLRQVLYNFHRNNNHPKDTDSELQGYLLLLRHLVLFLSFFLRFAVTEKNTFTNRPTLLLPGLAMPRNAFLHNLQKNGKGKKIRYTKF
jgi:hypothetical protein